MSNKIEATNVAAVKTISRKDRKIAKLKARNATLRIQVKSLKLIVKAGNLAERTAKLAAQKNARKLAKFVARRDARKAKRAAARAARKSK